MGDESLFSMIGCDAENPVEDKEHLRDQLLRVLEDRLSLANGLGDDDEEEECEGIRCPFSEGQRQEVDSLMALSPGDVNTAAVLKSLPFKVVRPLLAYCGYLLQLPASDTSPRARSPTPSRDAAAAEWLGLLLDGHFLQVSLDTGSAALLLRLQQVIGERTEEAGELTQLAALTAQLEATAASKPQPAIGSYAIQLLSF